MIVRPRIRAVLLAVSLAALALPVLGIWGLRLYDAEIVRHTETELIVQGAFVAALYREALDRHWPGRPPTYGRRATYRPPPASLDPGPWRPQLPQIELASAPTLPRPPPSPAGHPPHPHTLRAGATIEPILREAQRITLAGIRVTDHQGVVLASTSGEHGLSFANREEVAEALTGRYASRLRERETEMAIPALESISRWGVTRVYAVLPIMDGERVLGTVVMSRSPPRMLKVLYPRRWQLIVIAAALVGIAVGVALVSSLAIARPLRAVVDQARAVAAGRQGVVEPIAHPVTLEIHELSRAIAQMSRTQERRADFIRGFAASVGHEFKSPIAAIRGAVELLSGHDMAPSERDRFIGNIAQDASRLERLVARLMAFARADVMRVEAGTATRLGPVLDEQAARHRDVGGQIDIDPRLADQTVAVGADALRAILGHLLENARTHGGGSVHVRRIDEVPGGFVGILVADDGPGISAGNAGRVFDPFFTTARERDGTGMGLPIARALAAAHGGRLELAAVSVGAGFRLELPRADADTGDCVLFDSR